MTDTPFLEIGRMQSSEWPYPAYGQIDNVESLSLTGGKNSERGDIETGSLNVKFHVDRGDETYATDYYKNPTVVNGFSLACSDYLSELENSLNIYPGALMTYEGPVGTGKVQFLMQTSTSSHEWRIGNDIGYYAEVDEYMSYVVSFATQEMTGLISSYPLAAKVHWFTETGAYISSTTWRSASTTVNVETRVHAKVTTPAGAAYASLGATSSANVTGTAPHIRFSKFMIHPYDAAYELANGTMLKPFAIDDLYSYPIDSAPNRIAFRGNQFKTKDHPKNTIGSDKPLKQFSTYNIAPGIYSFDTMTTGTVGNYMYLEPTKVLGSIITSDFVDGTQCLRLQTAVGATRLAIFSPNAAMYNIPVVPGNTYTVKWRVKNKAVGSATFDAWFNDSLGGSTKFISAQVIAGSSAWVTVSANIVIPAGVYNIYNYMIFAANGYDLYIDKYEVFQVNAGLEPARTDNSLGLWGTFEDTSSMWLLANTSISSTGANFKHVTDNTATPPSGMKFISLDKPLASTQESIRYARSSDMFSVWVEPLSTYRISYWAKKTNANTTNIQDIYRFNDVVSNAAFSTFTARAMTTTWTEYEQYVTVPATASAITFAQRVQGSSSDACQVYIDNVSITRVPVQMVSTSTIDEANRTRTTRYQVESPANGTQIHMMYGNDLVNDISVKFNGAHSGKTRTRLKLKLEHDLDLPVGAELWAVPIGSTGRHRINDNGTESNGDRATPAWDQAVQLTIPLAGVPTYINLLAPDVPFRSWTWSLYVVLPKGRHIIGFKFTDEYMGPDGYESLPGTYENVRFKGKVTRRLDDVSSMSISNQRYFPITLECNDKMGQLQAIKFSTPHQQSLLSDNPIAYMPGNQDDLSEIGGRISRAPEFVTAGEPSGWGVTYDSEATLAGVNSVEGGSLKFTGSGSALSGQLVKIADPSIKASPGAGFTIGASFKHEAAITSPSECIFGQVISGRSELGGIYAYLTGSGINAGVVSGVTISSYPNLDTDGQMHQIFVTYDGVSKAGIYLDGVGIGEHTVTKFDFDATYIGGNWINGGFNNMFNGWIGHVAMYDYALTGTQIAQHWKSASNGFAGETEVERFQRILKLAKQSGIPPIIRDSNGDIPESLSTMGAPSWSAGTTPRELLSNVAKSVGGQFLAAANGDLIYQNRKQRFNYGDGNVQSWLIGNDSDIQPEFVQGMKVGPDSTKIINDAMISLRYVDDDKAKVQRAINRDSARRYRTISFDDTYDLQDPEDARYAAQWLVNTNDKPYPRYERLAFISRSGTATENFCKNVKFGDYVHGNLAFANGLDGGIIDGFVERISEDMEMIGSELLWTMSIVLSPAKNQLVLKVNDSTYGVLNAGFKLGY